MGISRRHLRQYLLTEGGITGDPPQIIVSGYTLFSQALILPLSSDNTNYTMGVQFTVNRTAQLNAIWWYAPTGGLAMPTEIALYQAADPSPGNGVLLNSQTATWSGGLGSGWVRAPWTVPPVLTAGVPYKACVLQPVPSVVWYGFIPDYWSTGPGSGGISNGPLNAPNNAGSDGGQNSFNVGPGLTYPTQAFEATNYGIDVEVQ